MKLFVAAYEGPDDVEHVMKEYRAFDYKEAEKLVYKEARMKYGIDKNLVRIKNLIQVEPRD